MSISVIKERCPQNHPCPSVKVCPVGALKQTGNRAPEINEQICSSCGKCVKYCPMGAFRLDKK